MLTDSKSNFPHLEEEIGFHGHQDRFRYSPLGKGRRETKVHGWERGNEKGRGGVRGANRQGRGVRRWEKEGEKDRGEGEGKRTRKG